MNIVCTSKPGDGLLRYSYEHMCHLDYSDYECRLIIITHPKFTKEDYIKSIKDQYKTFKNVVFDNYTPSPNETTIVLGRSMITLPYKDRNNYTKDQLLTLHLLFKNTLAVVYSENHPQEYPLALEYFKPKEVKYNSNACFHILAPYLLIFTPRLSKGSPAVQQRIKDGHEYTVCDPKRYREEVQITSIEIGMFASTLSALALEKEIDVSYNKNFCHWPKFKEYWKELPFVDEPPYLLMSLGYRRYKNKIISRPLIEDEYKENIDDIINWV